MGMSSGGGPQTRGPGRTVLRGLAWLFASTRWISLVLMGAGTWLVVAAYTPGLMTPDTTSIFDSVRSGHYTDWHAPLLAALWRPWYRIGFGPPWVFTATVALFVIAVYLLLRPWMPRLLAALLAGIAPMLPQLLGYLGVLMRDTWAMVLFALAFALAVRGVRSGISDRRRLLLAVLSVACSWLSIASRQNGLPSAAIGLVAATLVVWPVVVSRWGGSWSRRRRRLAGAGLWLSLLLVVVGSQQVLLRVLDVQRLHPEQATMINDLAAMSLRRGEVLFSPSVLPSQSLAELREQSTSYNINGLVFGPEAGIPIPMPEPRFEQLRSDWIRALRSHPLDYLASRWKLYSRQISISGYTWAAQDPGLRPNPYGYDLVNPDLNEFAFDYLRNFTTENVNGGEIHRVWIYLGITGVTMVWLAFRRTRTATILLLMGAASYAYSVSMFFGATSLQYRYSLPCVLTGIVFFVVLVADVIRASGERRASRRYDDGPPEQLVPWDGSVASWESGESAEERLVPQPAGPIDPLLR